MKKFINYLERLQAQKKLTKTHLYLSAFGILLFLTLALTLPNYLLKQQQIVRSQAQTEAATTYFSADFETGNISQWDGCAPHAAGQNVDPVAVQAPSPVHSGQYSGDYTVTQTMKDIGIAQNDGAARQCYADNFAPGLGRGPQGGMLEGYFSAWYWFDSNYAPMEGAWHNIFQWHCKMSGGCDQTFAFLADKRNGVFQIQASQRNCLLARHPLTPQPCPMFTGYTSASGGLWQNNPVPLPKNQWVHFEAYYRASRTNGAVKFWQNGQLIYDLSNANIQPGTQFNTFDSSPPQYTGVSRACIDTGNVQPCYTDVYWLVNNYVATQGNPGTETMYVDDAKVTDTYQGPGASPLTPTPASTTDPAGWWKLDESSGTTATDTSGNANTGTLTNGPVWITGKLGSALSFDGVNDYVTVPSSASLDLTGSFTIATWTRFTNTTNYGFLVSKSQGGVNGYELFRDIGSGRLRFSIGNASGNTADPYFDIATPSEYNDGQWHHVAAVYDRGVKAHIFIDGVNVATSGNNPSATVGLTTSVLLIGARGAGGGAPFQGDIDDLRVYNRALSTAEITALANPTNPTPLPTNTPVPTNSPVPTPTNTPTPTPLADTIKPTVTITSPPNGSRPRRKTNVTVQATASDNVSVTKVEFRRNGALVCADLQAPYSCPMFTANSNNTTVTYEARAYDAAGNTASHSISVITQN